MFIYGQVMRGNPATVEAPANPNLILIIEWQGVTYKKFSDGTYEPIAGGNSTVIANGETILYVGPGTARNMSSTALAQRLQFRNSGRYNRLRVWTGFVGGNPVLSVGIYSQAGSKEQQHNVTLETVPPNQYVYHEIELDEFTVNAGDVKYICIGESTALGAFNLSVRAVPGSFDADIWTSTLPIVSETLPPSLVSFDQQTNQGLCFELYYEA